MTKILAILLLSQLSYAATNGNAADFLSDAPVPHMEDYYSAKDASDIVASWASGKRKPAAVEYAESNMSKSMIELRNRILKVKTADQLAKVLTDLRNGFDKVSDDDTRFFGAQVLLLQPLRGIVWRLRPLFETKAGKYDFFSGNKATHSAAVTALRFVYHTTRIYIPTVQSDALFQYLTIPSKDMRSTDSFRSVPAYQAFLRKEMYTALDNAARTVKELMNKHSTPYVFDNQILYGIGTFDDGAVRFVGIDDAEVAATQAALQGAMHNILYFYSYNFDQVMNVAGSLGKLYGTDGFSNDQTATLGVTSEERRDTLESYRSRDFLAIRKSKQYPNVAYDCMKAALVHLRTYASSLKLAHDVMQAQPANPNAVFNPLFFKAEAQPRLGRGVVLLEEIATRETHVRSPITGETVIVDVPNFYNNPPSQMLDLLPNSFQKVPHHEDYVDNNFGERLFFRNYSEGRPNGWKPEWKRMFPKLSKGQSVSDAFRVIEYSSGPGIILGPMSSFIL